jgi:hypothetical protein
MMASAKKPVPEATDAAVTEPVKAPAEVKQAPTPVAPEQPKPDLAKAKAPAEEQPAPKPAAASAPPAPASPATVTYRVWAYGSLQRNGKTHKPGDTLTMAPEDGDAIVCLERV